MSLGISYGEACLSADQRLRKTQPGVKGMGYPPCPLPVSLRMTLCVNVGLGSVFPVKYTFPG